MIVGIAGAHGRTPAQVMLRWHLQEGRSAIPKSVRPERIAENFDVFDFELTTTEVEAIDGLDTGVRGGRDPATITPELFQRDIPEAWAAALAGDLAVGAGHRRTTHRGSTTLGRGPRRKAERE